MRILRLSAIISCIAIGVALAGYLFYAVSAPPLPRGLECVQSAPSGSLSVTAEIRGCFGGSSRSIEIEWDERSSWFLGNSDEGLTYRSRVGTQKKRSAVDDLLAAIERPEIKNGWSSTTGYVTTLKWRCGTDGALSEGETELKSYDTVYAGWDDEMLSFPENIRDAVLQPYNRAYGAGVVVDALLAELDARR